MECEDSAATPDDEAASVSGASGLGLDLQDTFVTLQTKEGQSSQKIPLFKFLEQAMGAKVDADVKVENISQLLLAHKTPANSDEKRSTQGNHALGTHVDNSTTDNTTSEKEAAVEGDNPLPPNVPLKPKGRGRPRKIKIDIKREETSEKVDHHDTAHQDKKEESSISATETVEGGQVLRRSSRIPAKNSRFKDDFVDSSLLASKSVSSGDTRLMTLALAAECHTTKPNKSNTSQSRGQPPKVGSFSKDLDNEERDSTAQTDNKHKSASKEDGREGKEYCDTPKHPSPVLKRPLHTQLKICLSSTTGEISSNPVQEEQQMGEDPAHPFHYYIITEPSAKPSSDALLVKKCDGEIQFNAAVFSGPLEDKVPDHHGPDSFPQTRYFACNLCDKIFLTAHHWQLHCKHVHNKALISRNSSTLEKEVHLCNLCNQKFPFQFMLENHLQKQAPCNSFSCAACEQIFPLKEDLDIHCAMAHPMKSCVLCMKSFDDTITLRRHLKDCQDTGSALHSLSEDQKLFVRDAIDGLKNETDLNFEEGEMFSEDKDSESIDTMESGKVSTPLSRIECEFCNVKFSSFSALWSHKLEVHQEFFPSALKEKLEARLEKNQQTLSSLPASNSTPCTDSQGRNNFFIIMKPTWHSSRPQLRVSLENKVFNFSPVETSTEFSGDLIGSDPSPLINKVSLFHCMSCSVFFLSASEYREHRSRIHSACFETVRYQGAFQCTSCSDTFPCEFMLKEHIKQHKNRKLLPCTLCGLTFHKIQERRQHWKQVHPGVGCPNCGKMYASIKYLQKHIALNCQDHFPATKKFIAFQQRQHNDFHMEEKDKRAEKKIIKCHLCPKICSSIHGWRRHMSESHESDGFSKLSNTCIICNEVIYGYKALEKHLLEVHAEDSGLPIEEENTIVKEALKKSKMDIQDYLKAGKSHSDIYQDEEGLFHCPECPKTHSDLKALNIHRKTHVNMQLECSICQKAFKNPTLLKQHVMRHRTTAVYSCETCNKKFMTLQKLNKHNKVHHSKESFVCELCGMSFALNDYLLKHKRCHTDSRPHVCSVCGKTFRTKPELRVHVLIHTQETPYVCEHCGRGFTQKGNWRIHLAQHTGVKPHKCHLCDLSFALPSHLKRHLVTHNQKINYRCIWCDKECTQRKHMQMHVARVHKEDFFQYEEQMKLESPIPIAPSQLKIYNRRVGKSGQVRRPYKTRAKKCTSSIQDIMDGIPRLESSEQEVTVSEEMMKPMADHNEDTVTSNISLSSQDMVSAENMQILVREDHQGYAKHNITAGLIEEDGSNVEIVMGENNEINIIINNADTDLSLPDSLDETGHVSLTHLTDPSSSLPSSLQQAVNALVADQKEENGVVPDPELPLDMEAMMTEDHTDNFTIVYPSTS